LRTVFEQEWQERQSDRCVIANQGNRQRIGNLEDEHGFLERTGNMVGEVAAVRGNSATPVIDIDRGA